MAFVLRRKRHSPVKVAAHAGCTSTPTEREKIAAVVLAARQKLKPFAAIKTEKELVYNMTPNYITTT